MFTSDDQKQCVATALLGWIDNYAPHGVIVLDKEFRVQGWNKWMELRSALVPQDVVGRTLFELFPDISARGLHGPFNGALKGEVSLLSTSLHGYLLPLPPVAESGYKHMQQTARIGPLLLGQQVCGIIVLIEDVTQREWQSAILRGRHQRDELLSWALGYLLTAEDPRRIAPELFCKVGDHLDFETYFLYLAEPESNLLRLHAIGGVPVELQAEFSSVPSSAVSWVNSPFQKGVCIFENVQCSADPLLALPKSLGIRAYVTFPLVSGPESFGVLCFATRVRDTISQSETDLIKTLAQYLAVALEREKAHRELRQARDKLNDHARDLEKTVADRTSKLREIIAELETFSYSLAHDLRAPIRALTGYTDVLMEDFGSLLPHEAHTVIQKLGDSAKRLDQLTLDLLAFSKISRQEIELETTNVADVLEEVLAAFGSDRASIAIEHPLYPVLANPILLKQCLTNLLENALKFVSAGRPAEIRLWTEMVDGSQNHASSLYSPFSRSLYSLQEAALNGSCTVTTQPEVPHVRIWVEDNGIGISSEARARIFGIFERGEITSEYEGTGIGLAIVTRAAERMYGTCGVESTPGVGSRFWLELTTKALSPAHQSH